MMTITDFPITVAYNMRDKKIGCVLIQAAMGATISRSWVALTFKTELWELGANKCQLYTINSQTELDFMVRITKEAND